MELSPFQTFLFYKYVPTVNNISAFLALFVILFMIGMSIYDRKLVDRVSLRLQTALAVYDIWLHTGSLWRTPYSKGPGPLCTFFGWSVIAFTLFYAFINVSIAVNLQLVFIHNKQITRNIEIAYWVVPVFLSLLITIPPLALGMFGWSDYRVCYIAMVRGGEQKMKLFDFFGAQLWRLLAIVYLIVVVVIVFMKLKRGATLIDSQRLNMDPGTSPRASRAIRALGYRILLYPLVMLIAHTAGILSQIHDDFSDTPNTFLDSWTMLTYPLVGLLNFIAFCFDPTVHNAVKVVYHRIIKKPNDDMKDDATQVGIELNGINSHLEEGKGPDYYSNDYASNEAFSALIKSL